MRFFHLILLAVLALATAVPARAATSCSARDGLRKEISRTITDERAWSRRWGLTWGGLIAAQLLTTQLISSDAKRTDLYVGSIGATVGLTGSYLIGPRILWPSSKANLLVERAEQYDDAPCDDLAALERVLEQAAQDERFMHSWAAHVGSKVFTLGMAALLGFGYHHWTQAAVNTGVGFALGEWMIATRPRTAVEALERYRRGERAEAPSKKTMLHYGLALTPQTTQLVLGVTF